MQERIGGKKYKRDVTEEEEEEWVEERKKDLHSDNDDEGGGEGGGCGERRRQMEVQERKARCCFHAASMPRGKSQRHRRTKHFLKTPVGESKECDGGNKELLKSLKTF